MFMRLLNIAVIGALVFAAAYVYDIKYESTMRGERAAKLRNDIRRERDSIAALRAEWSQLGNPRRIQSLAQRHLSLKPIEPTQFDSFDRLPERPPQIVPPESNDPISAMIQNSADAEIPTGAIKAPAASGGR
jgi:cell division protein FtsL